LLVNDQPHKMQPEALSQLILRLKNQKISGYGPHTHLTDLLDQEFQALSGFINLGILLHTKSNMKREANSTLRQVC
jgi:hypothetical protein